MVLTVQLPNDLANHEDPAREALEALALEAYRTGSLTHHDASRLIGLGRLAFDDLVKAKGVTVDSYGVEDFMEDVRTGDAMRVAGQIAR